MRIVGARWGLVAVSLAMVPVLAACGARGEEAAGPDAVLARNAVPGLPGRACHFVSEHDAVPTFSRVARIGARGNIALWGLHLDTPDRLTLSIRYDDEGRLGWVEAIESSSVPGERVAALERLLRTFMNERGPPDWGVRLMVVGGRFAGLEPSVICPAEIRRGGGGPVISLPRTQRGRRELAQARGRRFRVQISIDERGRVVDVRLPGVAGDRAVDQLLLDWAFATRFHPKLHDGLPLPTTVEQSVQIRRRR